MFEFLRKIFPGDKTKETEPIQSIRKHMQDLEIKNKTLREENTLLRNTLIGKENTIRKQEKDEISARRKAFGTEEEKQKKESDLSSLATTTKITRILVAESLGKTNLLLCRPGCSEAGEKETQIQVLWETY